jgi:RNA-directed DNA polymerase
MKLIKNIGDIKNLKDAFQGVKENRGCAGGDGVTIKEFGRNLKLNLRLLAIELEEKRYRSLPLLRFLVAKGDGSPRALTSRLSGTGLLKQRC